MSENIPPVANADPGSEWCFDSTNRLDQTVTFSSCVELRSVRLEQWVGLDQARPEQTSRPAVCGAHS